MKNVTMLLDQWVNDWVIHLPHIDRLFCNGPEGIAPTIEESGTLSNSP